MPLSNAERQRRWRETQKAADLEMFHRKDRERKRKTYLPGRQTQAISAAPHTANDLGEQTMTYTVDGHRDVLCGAMEDMWRAGKLCDAAIEVGSRVFKAHKLVLAACSPVLCSMAASLQSSGQMLVQLPMETNVASLEQLLHFIYYGAVTFTTHNCHHLRKLAQLFNIEKLLEFCEKFETENFPESCATITGNGVTRKCPANSVKTEKLMAITSRTIKRGTPGRPRGSGLKAGALPTRGRGRGLTQQTTSTSSQPGESSSTRSRTGAPASRTSRGRGRATRGRGRGSNAPVRGRSRGRQTLSRSRFIVTIPKPQNKLAIGEQNVVSEELADSIHERPAKILAGSLTSAMIREPDVNVRDGGGNDDQVLAPTLHSSVVQPVSIAAQQRKARSRAEIQRAYRERKLSKMSTEKVIRHRAQEALRVRLGVARRKLEALDSGSQEQMTEDQIKRIKNGARKKRWREKQLKNNPEQFYEQERQRVKKKYIPRGKLSKEQLQSQRERNRVAGRKYYLNKKIRALEDQLQVGGSNASSAMLPTVPAMEQTGQQQMLIDTTHFEFLDDTVCTNATSVNGEGLCGLEDGSLRLTEGSTQNSGYVLGSAVDSRLGESFHVETNQDNEATHLTLNIKRERSDAELEHSENWYSVVPDALNQDPMKLHMQVDVNETPAVHRTQGKSSEQLDSPGVHSDSDVPKGCKTQTVCM